MSYRRYSNSKFARKQHKKREKARKKKFGGLAAFAYGDCVGRSLRQMRGSIPSEQVTANVNDQFSAPN